MVAPVADARAGTGALRRSWPLGVWLPVAAAVIAFVFLFANPAASLMHAWLTDDDAGQGILLFPVALWLAWRAGLQSERQPAVGAGTAIIASAVLIRALGALASELFSQRFAIWLAVFGIVVFYFGWRQVRHWWLPLAVLLLAIPMPALLTNALAIPLQFRASRLGTALIHWRNIPVRTSGNVIQLPNATLFVAEACSGLRSLSALLGLGVLVGGMYLRTSIARIVLLLLVIPTAVVINAVRIFLTAFLVYFVDPSLGAGAAHERQGLLMFIVAFVAMAAMAALLSTIERFAHRRMAHHA